LEIVGGSTKPASPFKFNSYLLSDESFQSLVKDAWVPFDAGTRSITAIQFTRNLKTIKQVVVPCAQAKRIRHEQELRSIEYHHENIHQLVVGGYESTISKESLKSSKVRHRKLLEEKEAVWKQKS